jgi:hypothetical protein
MSKSFLKIQTYNLDITFCHKSSLVSCHHTVFILIIRIRSDDAYLLYVLIDAWNR